MSPAARIITVLPFRQTCPPLITWRIGGAAAVASWCGSTLLPRPPAPLRRFEALPLRTYRDGDFRETDPILAVLGLP